MTPLHPRRAPVVAVLLALTALFATACSSSSPSSKPQAAPVAVQSASSGPSGPGSSTTAPPPGSPSPSVPPNLTAAQTTKVTIQPSRGQTVGVGMPISLTFDKPVTDKASKAAIEKALTVTTTPVTEGSWGWVSDQLGYDRIDWRPKDYWKPGTTVTLDAHLTGVPTGAGRYLVRDYQTQFTVGTARISTVDVGAHTMSVTENGTQIRSFPISAGSPDHATWSGTMVVLEKDAKVRMDSETVGLGTAYNQDVSWAVRLTTSGTFVHSAPWNASKMGNTNASHGCVGMNDADAQWFFDRAQLGDIVIVTNSTKPDVDPGNGFGDWNMTYASWQSRSALT